MVVRRAKPPVAQAVNLERATCDLAAGREPEMAVAAPSHPLFAIGGPIEKLGLGFSFIPEHMIVEYLARGEPGVAAGAGE